MWFQRWADRSDLGPFFEAGRRMGFSRFELSHDLGAEAIDRIEIGADRIVTVHHPCPRPADYRRAESLCSLDPDARERTVAAISASLRTASRLGAEVLVLHLGRLEFEAEAIRRLRFELESRHRAGQAGEANFLRPAAELRGLIERHEAPALDLALPGLETILELAEKLGLRVGLETGYHADELPTAAGMAQLLDRLSGPPSSSRAIAGESAAPVGAWLDTGHAGARAALAQVEFEDWFAAVGGRWLGAHVHDLVGLRDHLLPGMGALPLARLLRRLPEKALLSLEIDWYFEEAEILDGIRHLSGQGLV
jgi:sugar phosphate isomerase/epimerase